MRLGAEEPRLSTPPLRRLTPATSKGFEVIRFAEQFTTLELLPWQRWWLIHALELRPDGKTFRFRTILTLVARQNGKTTLLQVLTAWALYSGHSRLVLGAAQNLGVARESWESVIALTEENTDLLSGRGPVRRGAADMTLHLRNGARYKITSANPSAGRGLSVDLLILDELREHRDHGAWNALTNTTMARPNPLIVGISNAGDDRSVVLNGLRDSALAGNDDSLAVFEWSAVDGCDLDDEDAWAAANPGLGRTITPLALQGAMSTSTVAGFRTENLCQRVSSLNGAIDHAAWRDCADPTGTLESLRDRVVLGLDVSLDTKHVTLAAAALGDDDRVRLEVVAAWDSTNAARAELPALLERVSPRALGWFTAGPAAALTADLANVRRSTELKGADVTAACMGLAEQVSARRILHADDPLMNAQVAQASRLSSGDGWRFTRRGGGHVDAVYAAAAAVHLARTASKRVGKPRILIAS